MDAIHQRKGGARRSRAGSKGNREILELHQKRGNANLPLQMTKGRDLTPIFFTAMKIKWEGADRFSVETGVGYY